MNPVQRNLPAPGGKLFLTDGGMETTLIFQDGLELPHFAAFDLLKSDTGYAHLAAYYARFAKLARDAGHGLLLDTPTWRASSDWAKLLGYSDVELDRANLMSVQLTRGIRDRYATAGSPMVISGCIGPRGDGYSPDALLHPDDAEAYHATQIATFADAGVDLVSAMTMTHTGEAIGIVRAARRHGVPVAISFTVETDGRLPSGEALGSAIDTVDAETGAGALYFMINCAHPDHFAGALDTAKGWTRRILGVRVNASRKSHAELDAAEELDEGYPAELGCDVARLRRLMPHLSILGGCCGTDQRHIAAIAHEVSEAQSKVA